VKAGKLARHAAEQHGTPTFRNFPTTWDTHFSEFSDGVKRAFLTDVAVGRGEIGQRWLRGIATARRLARA